MKADDYIVDSCYYDFTNYAAECCNHVQFRERLFGKNTGSGKILSKYWLCPYCNNPLEFGDIKKGENVRKCALKHVGKIASLFNRPCRLKTKFGIRFQEVGKPYYVRVFKRRRNIDEDYYIVSFEDPEMTGSFMHFDKGSSFRKYFEFVD
jgi:hypothetical protein